MRSLQQKQEIREEESQAEEEGRKLALTARDYRRLQTAAVRGQQSAANARAAKAAKQDGQQTVEHENHLKQPEQLGRSGEAKRDANEASGTTERTAKTTLPAADESNAGDEPGSLKWQSKRTRRPSSGGEESRDSE